MAWLLLVAPLLAGCGSVSTLPNDGGGGGTAGDAGTAGRGGDSGRGGGSAGTAGVAGASGAGGGAAGWGGAGTAGAGVAGSGVAGRGGTSGGAGTSPTAGAGGSGGASGRGGVGGGAGSSGSAGTAGSGSGGRGGSGGGAGAASGGRGGAATGGTGGSTTCPTPPSGAPCGCGARLDCNGVCAPVGTCTALAFDGTTGQVSTDATTALAMNQSTTIEAWVRVRNHLEDAPIFRKVRGNAEDKTLALHDGYVRFYLYRGGPEYIEIRSRNRIPVDAWTHIAGVYDGTNVRIYVNGVRTDTAVVDGVKAISNADGEIFIGRVHTMYNVTFDGVISDVRVSSTPRYSTETFVPAPLLTVDPATLALWRLDEGTGVSIADIGPSRLNASITRASATGPPRWVSAPTRN
jgi:hypothetical protein